MTRLDFSKRYLLMPVVMIVFFFFFYLVYDDIKDRTINEFNHEQLILAQTAAQGIASAFDDYLGDLKFIAEFEGIINFTEDSRGLIERFHDNHNNLIKAITRVDSKGNILFTYPHNESVLGKNISYQKHVQQVITTHKPIISDVFMAVQGYLAIAMHVPVFKEGEFNGSLAILVPINELGELYLGEIKIRGTGNIWLLSEDGIEIYCPFDSHQGKSFLDITNHEPLGVELMDKINEENHGTARSIHQQVSSDGGSLFEEEYMVFYRVPLKNTHWTIVISYEEKDIYKALARLRNRLLLIFAVLFLIMGYYFYSHAKVRHVLREEAKRKKAERTLRESDEKFRTIFDESPIGIELYEADGRQVNANKASLRMFGISDVAEINAFNLFDGTSLGDENKEKLLKGEAVSYQAQFDFEKVKELKQYNSSRSGRAYFDYIITPLMKTGRKTIYGYLLQVQDISERKKAQEEILMLAHALRSVNECVSITDMEDVILFVNDSFASTYGYTVDELIGENMSLFRSPDNSSEMVHEILPATIKGGWKGELINKRKNGSEFPVSLSTTVIQDKDGKSLGLIGVASDITERKRIEKELILAKEKAEESDRLKSAFLANMSHEIRTPMNGILGFSELLKDPDLTGEVQNMYIGIIESSGARMLNIIDDLIDISKIEAGQMKVVHSATDIQKQIEYTYLLFKPEAEKKGLEMIFESDFTEEHLSIETDREKLYAILANLVKNAIKYTHHGFIAIRCRKSGKYIEFSVKDSGIGVEKVRQKAIFDRFVQADIEDKRAYQGAGLGLSISSAYVKMLGGKIWVESNPQPKEQDKQGESNGSTFFFTIPYKKVKIEQNLPGPKVQGEEEININKSLKLLIVEDDEPSELLIRTALGGYCKEILIAKTGFEALEICQMHSDLDLVLMDIKIPEMDGFETTRQVRLFNKELVIIAQTAYGLTGDRDKAIAAGCDDYLPKPIRKRQLLTLIEKYFS